MPNICRNTLTVTGPEADVAAFVEQARGKPPRFAAPASPALREVYEEERRSLDALGEEQLSFHALVPIPAGALALPYDSSSDPQAERFEGKLGWEWERELWGVQWGASESKLVEHAPGKAVYTYETPWGVGLAFFCRVSARFTTLTFEVAWAIEYGQEGFGRFEARRGELREKWPDWFDARWRPGAAPEEVEARVARVTSCDAWYELTPTFLLFDRPPVSRKWGLFEELPPTAERSGLDYVEAWTAGGTRVTFYVDARRCYTGATYLFQTTGQELSLRAQGYWCDDEDVPGAGRRASAQRLWPKP